MTCPECGLYPINLRSKHKLCVKCCYDVVRERLRKKRLLEKDKLKKMRCLSCKKTFVPHFKGNKFCGVECQKADVIHKKNEKWLESGKKKDASLKKNRSRKRKNPFNRFDENRKTKAVPVHNKFDSN